MEIVLLIALSLACGFVVGMVFLRATSKKSHKIFSTDIKSITEELKTTQQSEQILREEVQLLQNKLKQAFADPVTHLSGWQLFEDRLNRSIRESEHSHLPLAVLFVDIDDFKVINDGLSYEVGDALLREVAIRLQNCIRQVDTVCRFAKDTYVILLTQLIKPETSAVVAQRILQSLLDPFELKGHTLNITVCIGIAIFPADGKTSTALLRSADQALHLAKEKGHHIYQFYQEKLHAQSQRDLVLYNSLSRDAIFNEFVLYFSPIMNVETNVILCMEVLLHWRHSDLGLIIAHNMQTIFKMASIRI
jgi:diguanylate cyclase (GGDEF)-like protein